MSFRDVKIKIPDKQKIGPGDVSHVTHLKCRLRIWGFEKKQ